jgi:ATP-dependent DNA ligase
MIGGTHNSSAKPSLLFRVTSRLRFIEPQLASPVDQPPEGKHWIHEIKHDGYRSQVVIERGQVRVFSRNGYDWSDRYSGIVRAAASLRCKSAIIDGEAIVQDDDGRSDFESLQSAMRSRAQSIIIYAFDLCKTGALMALLAHSDSAGLNYAGAAFITLIGDERKEFLAEVEGLTTSWGAFKSSRATDVKWCQPRLVVRVKHLAGSKTLRHATVKGLET